MLASPRKRRRGVSIARDGSFASASCALVNPYREHLRGGALPGLRVAALQAKRTVVSFSVHWPVPDNATTR
ncbi:hypothetical protein C5E51_36145 [Nocardia nova]|nr:hypothetical protein C5E51_36145 [Nocardia nova]